MKRLAAGSGHPQQARAGRAPATRAGVRQGIPVRRGGRRPSRPPADAHPARLRRPGGPGGGRRGPGGVRDRPARRSTPRSTPTTRCRSRRPCTTSSTVRPRPPDPPAFVQATNLSDPARTAARGVHDTGRGFEVVWAAPPSIDPAARAYLPTSASAAPTEVAVLPARSHVGRPSVHPPTGDGVQLSGRNEATGTDTPDVGDGPAGHVPAGRRRRRSPRRLVHAIEDFEPAVLRYGEDVTYRVQSVDAIGRLSNPTPAAPVPLRTYVRPPAPTTPPPTTPVYPEAVPRTGVQVVLLQHDDPDLTAAQATVAAGADVVGSALGLGARPAGARAGRRGVQGLPARLGADRDGPGPGWHPDREHRWLDACR